MPRKRPFSELTFKDDTGRFILTDERMKHVRAALKKPAYATIVGTTCRLCRRRGGASEIYTKQDDCVKFVKVCFVCQTAMVRTIDKKGTISCPR